MKEDRDETEETNSAHDYKKPRFLLQKATA